MIFDEASQIPVWDAIGAIARGRQVIVVGDPKQLPPTAFFDRSSDGYDDATDLEDLESILDECLGANIPHKRLAWHYRSRHESLIAFSNQRYYEGRLVTFPSPVTEDRAVRYVHVPGGVYERGSGRVNREEARAVVREVVNRLLDPAFAVQSSSLGIVTFNTEQQRLIETMLDQERRSRTELERFFGPEWHEPVFVKNLETVQGDEREVILFSVGYGPDPAGRVSHNFGPLNKDGGTRRLNVAITRARSELVVFATLKPDHIDLSRTKAVGVCDFKHFLEYAERGPGALARAAGPVDREPESPFDEAVQKGLEEGGWNGPSPGRDRRFPHRSRDRASGRPRAVSRRCRVRRGELSPLGDRAGPRFIARTRSAWPRMAHPPGVVDRLVGRHRNRDCSPDGGDGSRP